MRPAFIGGRAATGSTPGLDAILERIELPRQTHLFALDEHLAALRRRFVYADPVPMLRMAVDAASFRASADSASVDRLGPGDLAALTELYAPYAENAFQPEQLSTGVFYGVPGWHAFTGRGGHACGLGAVRHRGGWQHLYPAGGAGRGPRSRGHPTPVVAELLAVATAT